MLIFQLSKSLAASALLLVATSAQAAGPVVEDATTKEMNAAAKAMADEFKAMGLGMTPEKQKAMDAVMQKHLAGAAPEMDAMGKTMAKSLDTPEMRASMDKVAKEMSGVMAKQLPVMMQAMQPMLADMLPRMLRMQADMLQILFAPPKSDAKTK